jgi:hypothetical protein
MVLLSGWLETLKAMRRGKLALIMPVMTSTLGRCVARMTWMPAARAFCARRAMHASTSLACCHHQVGELVDDHHDVRQLLGHGSSASGASSSSGSMSTSSPSMPCGGDLAHAARLELASAQLAAITRSTLPL